LQITLKDCWYIRDVENAHHDALKYSIFGDSDAEDGGGDTEQVGTDTEIDTADEDSWGE